MRIGHLFITLKGRVHKCNSTRWLDWSLRWCNLLRFWIGNDAFTTRSVSIQQVIHHFSEVSILVVTILLTNTKFRRECIFQAISNPECTKSVSMRVSCSSKILWWPKFFLPIHFLFLSIAQRSLWLFNELTHFFRPISCIFICTGTCLVILV